MAKRKRLTPAQSGFLGTQDAQPLSRPAPMSPAPIAQVAGEASAVAALGELSDAMDRAREEGRLMLSLPLDAVDAGYLVRDRLAQQNDDMAALKISLEARGQQTPIEVVELPEPKGGHTHGLISGWRRLNALKDLAASDQTGRFDLVQARLIAPESQQAAYVAMVEENEIRSDLSHYERARIARQAWKKGVYPTLKLSLNGLFGSVSRSRRSKINSFVPLVEALDQVLKWPASISEKLGLALSQAMREEAFRKDLITGLKQLKAKDAQEEIAFLQKALKPAAKPAPILSQKPVEILFDADTARIQLTGDGVTPELYAALQKWLKMRG